VRLLLPGQVATDLARVHQLLQPALDPAAHDPSKPGGLPRLAVTSDIKRAVRYRRAVYVIWDQFGQCRYVGKVNRSQVTAVGDRLGEHLRQGERRRYWTYITALHLHIQLNDDQVKECEGWASWQLGPADGKRRPRFDIDKPPRMIAAEAGIISRDQ
jgi:hypothetical protein